MTDKIGKPDKKGMSADSPRPRLRSYDSGERTDRFHLSALLHPNRQPYTRQPEDG
jgi:hypothetical protein